MLLSSLTHDLNRKMKRLEELRKELDEEQKKIHDVQILRPENQHVATFNEDDYRNMLDEFINTYFALKTKKSSANMKQTKITDFFMHSLKSENQNRYCNKDDFKVLLNGLVDRHSMLKMANLCGDKKQRKITDFYTT